MFELSPNVLRVGEPILFALRDKAGCLLVPRGTLLADEDHLLQLTARPLYVDEQDSENLKRAVASKIHTMVPQNAMLRRIAQARPDGSVAEERRTSDRADAPTAWSNLQLRASAVLRDPARLKLGRRVLQLQQTLLDQLERDADDSLLLLVHSATHDFRNYSVRHALLVTVLCELAARHLDGWEPGWRRSLRCADHEHCDDGAAGPVRRAGDAGELRAADPGRGSCRPRRRAAAPRRRAGRTLAHGHRAAPRRTRRTARRTAGEVAVVLRRGSNAHYPVVAAVVKADGTPLGEPALRNTTQAAHAVTAGVAAHEVKVWLSLDRFLAMA